MLNPAKPNIPVRAGVLILALISLTVLCVGRAGAAEPLSLNMNSFDFGAKNVGGEATQPGEFVVTNNSGSAVTLGRADTTPVDPFVFRILPSFDFCSFETLQPNESCDIVVIFEPTVAGEFTGTLEVNSPALTAPLTAALEGIGYPELLPDVKITPDRLDFGTHGIGTSSDRRTIEVKDTGDGDMRLGASEISGVDSADFKIAKDSCAEITMASGSVCRIDVVFTPGAAGIRNASLFVPTDVEGADTRVPLSGTGAGIVPPDPGTAKVKIAGKLPKVKGRKLKLPITCELARMEVCEGSVAVKAAGAQVARASYSVRPGTTTLAMRLKPRVKRALSKRGRLKVSFRLSVKQGSGEFVSHTVRRTLRR